MELEKFIDFLEKAKEVYYLAQFIREGYSGCDRTTKKAAMEYIKYFHTDNYREKPLMTSREIEKALFNAKMKVTAFYEDPALKETIAYIKKANLNSGKPFYVQGYFGRHWNDLRTPSCLKFLMYLYLLVNGCTTAKMDIVVKPGNCLLTYTKVGISIVFESFMEAKNFSNKNFVKESKTTLMDTPEKIAHQNTGRFGEDVYKTGLTSCSMFIENMYAELEKKGSVTWPELKPIAVAYAKRGTNAAAQTANDMVTKGIISSPAAREWKRLIALEVSQLVGSLMPYPVRETKMIPYGYTATVA